MEESEETFMTPTEIIETLNEANCLPVDALKAAATCREAMVPLFMESIEKYLAFSSEERRKAKTGALFYGFHLLGEWREKRAYKLMAQLLHANEDEAERLLGDATTSTTHRVMAGVYDCDPSLLEEIVLDSQTDPFVRSRMCEVFAMLVRDGLLEKGRAMMFLSESFEKIQPRTNCFVWYGWATAIAMLGLEELTPLVRCSFDEGCHEMEFGSVFENYEEFEKDLKYALKHPYERQCVSHNEYALWGDTIEDFSDWHWLGQSNEDDNDEEEPNGWPEDGYDEHDDFLGDFQPSGLPETNPYKDIGRNDPCLCGSGKKFKKCCGK